MLGFNKPRRVSYGITNTWPFSHDSFTVKAQQGLTCQLETTESILKATMPVGCKKKVVNIISEQALGALQPCQQTVVKAVASGILPHPVVIFQQKLHEHFTSYFTLTNLNSYLEFAIMLPDSSLNPKNKLLLGKLSVKDSDDNTLMTLSCNLHLPADPNEKLTLDGLELNINSAINPAKHKAFFQQLGQIFPVDTFYFDLYRLAYIGNVKYAFYEQDNAGRRSSIYPPFSNKLLTSAETVEVHQSLFDGFHFDVKTLLNRMQQSDLLKKMRQQLQFDLSRMELIVNGNALQIPKIEISNIDEYLMTLLRNQTIYMNKQQHLVLCYLLIQGYLNPHNKIEVELQSLLAQHQFVFGAKKNPGQVFTLQLFNNGDLELTVERKYRHIQDLTTDSIFEDSIPFLTITTKVIIPKNIQQFNLAQANSIITVPQYSFSDKDRLGMASAHMHIRHKILPCVNLMQSKTSWSDYQCTLLS